MHEAWPGPARSASRPWRRVPAFLPRPPAAFVAGAGAQVDDPIGRQHHLGAVLDHDHGMATLDQRAQGFDQFQDVNGVQAGGGLVEQEDVCEGPRRDA